MAQWNLKNIRLGKWNEFRKIVDDAVAYYSASSLFYD
jgi:hypothetical protein